MLPKSIHLNDLVCKSIHAVLDLKRVPLRGCAEGLELCRAESVLYIPEWGLQIANGIVPHEAILYEMHLDLALRQIPIEKSYLELDCVERSTDEVCILG